MGHKKRIVCLANSRKVNGRCIAGREITGSGPSGWVRPISAREHEEVSERERLYEDGSEPDALDVIDIQFLRACPKNHQQENWLLDPRCRWEKVGSITWDDLKHFEEEDGPLWVDGHKTWNGVNDKVPPSVAMTLRSSLRLIHVPSLTLRHFAPSARFGNHKRRLQARFRHAGVLYALWVTDPFYEEPFLELPDGEYELGESYLTISLGEPNPADGYCYKLVAAIIQREV